MTDTLIAPAARRSDARFHAAVLGIGTATPPAISQTDLADVSESFACDAAADTAGTQSAWLRRIYLRSGVARRGSVLAADGLTSARAFYSPPTRESPHGPSTADRMRRYTAAAPPLLESAARAALADAALVPEDITHLITVSCTGFHAPGLDVELIARLPLAPAVQRTHIGFMGCHAAFNALALAHTIVRADPAARVLVASVELCTLHFSYGFHPEKLVANALFADGAAAAIIGSSSSHAPISQSPIPSHSPRWQLLHSASLLLPNSQNAMTWIIGDHGFEMTLSAEIPALISQHLRPWVESWLSNFSAPEPTEPAAITHWAIHPGGPRILSAAASALSLPEPALHASKKILNDHGNMSSATVLFVLKHLLTTAHPGDTCIALGFGPGLMAEGMLLRCV